MENGHEKQHVTYNLHLESEELAEMDHSDAQTQGFDVALKPSEFETGPRVYAEGNAQRWKTKVFKLAAESSCSEVA
jgi:hypothetical protein